MTDGGARTPRVVTVIGGGTGSFHVLRGLRPYEHLWIQSVVTMMDSGGDSGRLRDEFGVLPPGDVRRCLVALSEESKVLRDLFSFRFEEEPLEGRSFGNLFFLAATKVLGSEKDAIEAIERILKIRGRVIAVTWDHAHLYAELADGTVVEGEANISVPKHDPKVSIETVSLKPAASANPDALEAIAASDVIVLAPGDLYTSVICNLLVEGVRDAIVASRAPLIYVLNLMTPYGETYGYSASRHVAEVARYAGRVPEILLAHEGSVPEALREKYEAQHAHQVNLDVPRLKELGVREIHLHDLMSASSLVRHDPVRTGKALADLIDDLTTTR